MMISEHYLGYPKKTLIVVTNNEIAKIFLAEKKEVEDIVTIKATIKKKEKGSADIKEETDEQKSKNRTKLYEKLSRKLRKLKKQDIEKIILCAPESLKNELANSLHKEISELVEEVIPKNLASLPLDAIIRILQEARA